MPKPICVKCETEYEIKKAGVTAEEMASFGGYKLWQADLLRCPKCRHEIITGFGSIPAAEHFQKERYQEVLDNTEFVYRF